MAEAAAKTTGADKPDRQAQHSALLQDLDRLLQKLESVAGELRKLRAERDRLSGELSRVSLENARLVQIAGVANGNELLAKMARLSELEKVNQALDLERAETARRLAALIEKVDLLQQET